MTPKNISVLILLLCFLTLGEIHAQVRDTLPLTTVPLNTPEEEGIPKDSARLALEAMPRKAAIRSAILPGLGQIYNRRWWKVPLVYGAYVGVGLVYEFNQRYYKMFLTEAQFRQENPDKVGDPQFQGWTTEGIIQIKDNYRRNRDLSILAILGVHAVQVIDAYIDAKFFRFDVSDDLNVSINPTFEGGTLASAPVPGIKLRVLLK